MEAVQANVIAVLLDFSNRRSPPEDAQRYAQQYGLQYLPTSFFLTPNGEQIGEPVVGAMDADNLIARLEEAGRIARRFQPTLDRAFEVARARGKRVAHFVSDGSAFSKQIEQTIFGDLAADAERYVWFKETREGAVPAVIILDTNEDRTERARREFRLADLLREVLRARDGH